MKKVILAVALLVTIGVTNSFGQHDMSKMKEKSEQTTISMASFGVRGNCTMCKKTIEKAANSVDGVTMAHWNKDQKMMMVSYDNSKTNEMSIHKAIAVSGYDTEKVKGNLDAYNNLPGCCKYDHDMKMNQTTESKSEHH